MYKEISSAIEPKADKIFEVSYEVCNRVGGIYRVLESKAEKMTQHYGDKYFLIGPYYKDKAREEFKEESPPHEMKKIFQDLENKGIRCHYGRWMVKGKPITILVDFNDYFYRVDDIKKEMWDNFGVDSLQASHDFNEPVCFSYAVAELMHELTKEYSKDRIVGHFHEWLCGAGLLRLKLLKSNIKTVFTTHATSLGRTLAFHSVNFYTTLEEIDPDKEVQKYSGLIAKHYMEKASALNCDIFTTVSEITKIEAKIFLGRDPEIVLPNGLDIEKFLSFEDIVIKHRLQRRRLRNFVAAYFFPYYTFDLEETLFYFIIGRKEFRAKGIDIFIDSLGKLNEEMKKENSNRTIVAFLFIPTDTKRIHPSILENIEYFRDMQDSLEGAFEDAQERLFHNILRQEETTKEKIFDEEMLLEIERKLHRMQREGENPPISTHYFNSIPDEILDRLNKAGLSNTKDDKVKVIYYPTYLTGHDGLSNLSYEEALEACHMGVFPSFYEPWGYTPLEAAALGVSSVTTDFAGFGRFRLNLKIKKDRPGIYILERKNRLDDEITHGLYNFLYGFMKTSRKERVENKIEARKIAAAADWQSFIFYYIKAHNEALQKK